MRKKGDAKMYGIVEGERDREIERKRERERDRREKNVLTGTDFTFVSQINRSFIINDSIILNLNETKIICIIREMYQ